MGITIMNVTEARQRFTELVRELISPVYVTVYGTPQAVIVQYATYEALLEKIEDLEDTLALYQREGEERIPLEAYLAEREGQGRYVPALSAAIG